MAPRKKRVSTIKAENDKGQKRKIKEENEDDDKDSGVSSMSPEPESPKLENVEESDSDDELCEVSFLSKISPNKFRIYSFQPILFFKKENSFF